MAEITRVGVIGAGQMGNGIAHVCALAGLPVVLLDANAEALPRTMAAMAKSMDRQVGKGTLTAEAKDQALGRIQTTTDYAAFANCDFVIEAATEREEIKHSIFKTLTPHLAEGAMLATNTSSISITRLAAATDRPERFIGMHFMNPVPVMKLVEVIRGIATDEPTFQAVQALAERLGKTTAVAEDFPGFIVNRILVPMIKRGCLRTARGRGQRDQHRHGAQARGQPSDGPVRARRFHWVGHLPFDHAGGPWRIGGQQIPALPAPREVCRSRVAGPQDRPRVLRLLGHPTQAHKVGCFSPSP